MAVPTHQAHAAVAQPDALRQRLPTAVAAAAWRQRVVCRAAGKFVTHVTTPPGSCREAQKRLSLESKKVLRATMGSISGAAAAVLVFRWRCVWVVEGWGGWQKAASGGERGRREPVVLWSADGASSGWLSRVEQS